MQKKLVLVCEDSLCPRKQPDISGPGLGEAGRYNVIRQRIADHDADAGVENMLDDFHEAHFDEGRWEEEEPEATAKAYYDMLAAAQQPLHGHAHLSRHEEEIERSRELVKSHAREDYHC